LHQLFESVENWGVKQIIKAEEKEEGQIGKESKNIKVKFTDFIKSLQLNQLVSAKLLNESKLRVDF
jgi:hypothetical protein